MASLRSSSAALVAATLLAAGCGDAEEPRPLNLIVVSIDTLRADRLGCYGYERGTSPVLDRFAAESVRFADVVAESSWTIPSHVTLFTGLHPASHGVQRPGQRSAAGVPFLAELLRDAGWRTFAITAGGWMRAEQGFDRGFEIFLERPQELARTLDEAAEPIRRMAREGPFFAFLHTYDVHCPYDPPPELLERFHEPESQRFDAAEKCGNTHFNEMELDAARVRHLSDRYDAGVAWVDGALGGLMRFLEAEDLARDTVVVITSDHGDELGENGRIGHGRTLYREVLSVPLLMRVPGMAPRVVEERAGLADLTPTLLDLFGLDAPPMDGRSLVPALRGERSRPLPGHLSELDWKRRLFSWVSGDRQWVLDRDTGSSALYAWDAQPGLVPAGTPREALEHERAFERYLEGLQRRPLEEGEAQGLAPEVLDELRALGY